MSLKTSIPISIGILLSIVALCVVGAAMFLTDQGEETLHLYKDWQAMQKKSKTANTPANPMELQGKWNGLTLSAANSPTAKALGIQEAEQGVVVADIDPQRSQQSGLMVGDMIVGVDQQNVGDLSDLFNVARTTSPASSTLVDVRRKGYPMSLVLPAAAYQPTLVPGAAAAGQEREVAPPSVAQPAAWVGQFYFCPRERISIPAASVTTPYVCPRCQGPLHPIPRGPQ
jgi:hypothetical protein